jgi:hypothetical protein
MYETLAKGENTYEKALEDFSARPAQLHLRNT